MIAMMYGWFYQEMLRYVLSLSKDLQLSEDVTQDTFMRAMRCADIFQDMEKPACRAWLYKTARNLFIDRVRRQRKELETVPGDEAAEDDLSLVMVNELVARLPQPDQAMFRMRYLEGMNATELGELFGMPAATVRTRLARACRALREEYLREKG